MITLALIGLLGGLITGVSPCVLPMLPIIFFAGTTGKTEPAARKSADGNVLVEEVEVGKPARDFRPLKIIAGIVVSFSLFTLAGSVILSALGLPDDFLRWGGLTILTLVGLGLIFPALGHWIEKPFYRLPKINRNNNGAFVLGSRAGHALRPVRRPGARGDHRRGCYRQRWLAHRSTDCVLCDGCCVCRCWCLRPQGRGSRSG